MLAFCAHELVRTCVPVTVGGDAHMPGSGYLPVRAWPGSRPRAALARVQVSTGLAGPYSGGSHGVPSAVTVTIRHLDASHPGPSQSVPVPVTDAPRPAVTVPQVNRHG